MDQITFYQDFKSQVMGKGYDIDGAYGNQCWDLYAKYSRDLGVPIFHCPITGYVQDIWTQRKTSGILKYFDEVTELKPGDVVIFAPVAGCTPLSHIALFDSDANGSYGYFLGQNQGAPNGVANIVQLPYSATYETALRPKMFAESTDEHPEIELKSERATATVAVTALIIRDYPSTKTGKDTGYRYLNGMSFDYDSYCVNDGYVWLSYIADSGNRRYVAGGEVDDDGRNVCPYCTFV